MDNRPVLHVCLTCRPAGAESVRPDTPTGGARLHDALIARVAARNLDARVRINPVTCMANCDQGCSAAASAPGKWSYIAGHLEAELADDLIDYALAYGESKTGVVMPSRRAPSLKDVFVARVPAHPDDLAENGDPS